MLEIKDLSAGYNGRDVLFGVSVKIERGKLTSIIGANGCGKSTLLRAAVGIISPSGGEIILDGTPLSQMKRREIARNISYLSQCRREPDMTVEQTVLQGRFPHLVYPRRYTERDRNIAHSAMERVGISHLADRPLESLSGGMRQSAYIAMALAQDTDYILLDEPTTYLDVPHRLELMRILRSLADGGKGVVTVMHDLAEAFELSDEIIVLDGGRVAAQAEPRELLESPEIGRIFGVRMKYLEKEKKYYYTVN